MRACKDMLVCLAIQDPFRRYREPNQYVRCARLGHFNQTMGVRRAIPVMRQKRRCKKARLKMINVSVDEGMNFYDIFNKSPHVKKKLNVCNC